MEVVKKSFSVQLFKWLLNLKAPWRLWFDEAIPMGESRLISVGKLKVIHKVYWKYCINMCVCVCVPRCFQNIKWQLNKWPLWNAILPFSCIFLLHTSINWFLKKCITTYTVNRKGSRTKRVMQKVSHLKICLYKQSQNTKTSIIKMNKHQVVILFYRIRITSK